jgi:hypothetical protein
MQRENDLKKIKEIRQMKKRRLEEGLQTGHHGVFGWLGYEHSITKEPDLLLRKFVFCLPF